MSPSSTTTKNFRNPRAHSSKKNSTQHLNLNYYYFTALTHFLLNIISSFTLPLTSLESLNDAIVAPPSGHTNIHAYRPVPSPILTPIKTPTDDPSIVLPTQLYTSVYFLCYITGELVSYVDLVHS